MLASRFALLKLTIQLEPEKVENIVLACCALHNFLRSKKATNTEYMGPDSVGEEDLHTGIIQPGQWRQEPGTTLESLSPQAGNRSSGNARDELCDYFIHQWTGAIAMHGGNRPRQIGSESRALSCFQFGWTYNFHLFSPIYANVLKYKEKTMRIIKCVCLCINPCNTKFTERSNEL